MVAGTARDSSGTRSTEVPRDTDIGGAAMGNILVTGTSTGIGLATAITLGRAGHKVFAGMRNLDRGAELLRVASAEILAITLIELDVDKDSSVDAAVAQILKEHGQIDVLVNNAGISGAGPVEEVPIDTFRKIMETNFFGGLRCIKAVLPAMRERQSGCIINVTSVLGQIGLTPQGAYASSKWAVEGLSECLAQELKPFNVRVAIVEPGMIVTPMTTTPRPQPPASAYSSHRRRLRAFVTAALEAQTSPFEVAKTIQDVVDGRNPALRHPSGPDAATLIRWRRSKTDDEWVNLGSASDAEWMADGREHLGLEMKL